MLPIPTFEWSAVRFGAPEWLPLLAVAGVLLILWLWQVWRRQRDRNRFVASGFSRNIGYFGDLAFWFCLLLALAATILALSRPMVVTSSVRTAGVDLVVLQDGSASMRVQDVPSTRSGQAGDRWQRSMRFLRTLGESLRWEDDRLALALFANIATPQIRLTRDPNTLFFFLDHLETEPPFRLKDNGTWDTNIERGIYWGLRVVDKDEEIFGPSRNARAFILVSDGQAWSGRIDRSLLMARQRSIPVHVVGVGTTAGGVIPEPARAANLTPVHSALDRNSLSVIATAAGGRYFELDREPDTEIANSIIEATRRRAGHTGVAEGTEDVYFQCLLAAAAFVLLAVATRAL